MGAVSSHDALMSATSHRPSGSARTVSSVLYVGILAGLLWVVPWFHDHLDRSAGALDIGAFHLDQPVRVYFATLIPAILIAGVVCLSALDCLGNDRRPFVVVPAFGLLVAVPYLLLTILFGTMSLPPDFPGTAPEFLQSRLHLRVWFLGMGFVVLFIYLSFTLVRWRRHTSFLARAVAGTVPTLLMAGLSLATYLHDRSVDGYNGVG